MPALKTRESLFAGATPVSQFAPALQLPLTLPPVHVTTAASIVPTTGPSAAVSNASGTVGIFRAQQARVTEYRRHRKPRADKFVFNDEVVVFLLIVIMAVQLPAVCLLKRLTGVIKNSVHEVSEPALILVLRRFCPAPKACAARGSN